MVKNQRIFNADKEQEELKSYVKELYERGYAKTDVNVYLSHNDNTVSVFTTNIFTEEFE